MTKKEFWRNASNWGLIMGVALFVVTLISWGFQFEAKNMGWPVELMHFVVIGSAILYTGRRNAELSGSEGYPYGRAVGYIFAMLMFAGIVYGTGRFLMTNFIARDYYDAINTEAMQRMVNMYQAPMADQVESMYTVLMTNPISLILFGVMEMVIKGGVLGLVLAAFVTKKTDIFAGPGPAPSCSVKDE
jgi:cytochrome c oxidase assembly factor CtaG